MFLNTHKSQCEIYHYGDISGETANYVAKLCNIIGNLESIHLESIVKRIYKHFNINYYDSITGKNVLFVEQSLRGCSTNINGYPEKLESLGWRPEYSIDKIIEDLSSNI